MDQPFTGVGLIRRRPNWVHFPGAGEQSQSRWKSWFTTLSEQAQFFFSYKHCNKFMFSYNQYSQSLMYQSTVLGTIKINFSIFRDSSLSSEEIHLEEDQLYRDKIQNKHRLHVHFLEMAM